MTEHPEKYIVANHSSGPFKEAQVGDEVTVYKVEWPFEEPTRDHPGIHAQVDAFEALVLGHADLEDWSVLREFHCDCSERRTVAQELLHVPTKTRWGVCKTEQVPKRFRRDVSTSENPARVHHGEAGAMPCLVGISSCRGCRARWAVFVYPDRTAVTRVLSATHGGRVSP